MYADFVPLVSDLPLYVCPPRTDGVLTITVQCTIACVPILLLAGYLLFMHFPCKDGSQREIEMADMVVMLGLSHLGALSPPVVRQIAFLFFGKWICSISSVLSVGTDNRLRETAPCVPSYSSFE